MSLQTIRKRKADPQENLPPITVKVVQIKKTKKVTSWEVIDGVPHALAFHENVTAAVTDGQSVMKFVLFDNLAVQVREGETYIVKGYGCSRYGGQCLLTRQETKIFRALKKLQVAPELELQACTLLTPVSPKIGVAEINTDVVDLVTVQGLVTSLELVEVLNVERGKPVAMRRLRLKEGGAEVAVCLWREANLVELSNGSPVIMTHMRVKNSPQYGFSLHSSGYTEIQIVPLQTTIQVKAVNLRENGDVLLLDDNLTEVLIKKEVWGFGEEVPPELLLTYEGGQVSNAATPPAINEI